MKPGHFIHPTGHWTILPPLPLRGIGTSMVESLDSYLTRLLRVTGWPQHAIRQLANARGDMIFTLRQEGALSAPTKVLNQRIAALEALTGQQHFRCGTLWALSQVVSIKAYGRATKYRRWCPRCYLDWEEHRSVEALAWEVALLEACPEHGCSLVDACPKCGATQPVQTPDAIRRVCRVCHALLGWTAPRITSTQSPFERWIDQQICSLIQLCADPQQGQLPEKTFATFFDTLSKCHGHRADLPSALRVSLRMRCYESHARAPTFRTLLNFAALQGCSVTDIVTSPESAASAEPLFGFWKDFDRLPLDGLDVVSKERLLEIGLERLLDEAGQLYLPPLAAVLDRAGIVEHDARREFPELMREYKVRYSSQGSGAALKRMNLAFNSAMRGLHDLDPTWLKQSMLYKLHKHVMRAGGISIEMARNICKVALMFHRMVRDAQQRRKTWPRSISEHTMWSK